MDTTNLAKNLKELRTFRGMSQEFLAEESRVSLRTIQRIENEESVPTGETIKRIAVALDIELDKLVGTHSISETNDLNGTIIFLKKKRWLTDKKSEVKMFEKFIDVLNNLKEKDLSSKQQEGIESYIEYLELEKIPSFNNDIFKEKFKKFKTYLKTKPKFVPNNQYTLWAIMFVIPFCISFAVQSKIETYIRVSVISVALLLVAIARFMDSKIKKQGRSLDF